MSDFNPSDNQSAENSQMLCLTSINSLMRWASFFAGAHDRLYDGLTLIGQSHHRCFQACATRNRTDRFSFHGSGSFHEQAASTDCIG